MRRLYEYAAVAAVVALMAYGVAWYNRPVPVPPGVTVPAAPAAEIKNEKPTETIRPPSVAVFKPAAKVNLKLPAAVTSDPSKHVLASSKTANDERQHTVTTVIDSNTGDVQTYDRTEPLPWLAVNTKTEVGAFYGLKHGEPTIRIEGRQEFLQIKAIHLGATAMADMNRSGMDGFIGVGAWARW